MIDRISIEHCVDAVFHVGQANYNETLIIIVSKIYIFLLRGELFCVFCLPIQTIGRPRAKSENKSIFFVVNLAL